jgi:hypothetical protein
MRACLGGRRPDTGHTVAAASHTEPRLVWLSMYMIATSLLGAVIMASRDPAAVEVAQVHL